jgi:Holliday junction resolvase-like predicted endonuclease
MAAPAEKKDGAVGHVRLTPRKVSEKVETPVQREPIAAFVDLEIEARAAVDLQALHYVLVNSTRRLCSYDIAVLVEPKNGPWQVSAASSVQMVDTSSDMVRTLNSWLNIQAVSNALSSGEARAVDLIAELGSNATAFVDFRHCLLVPIKCTKSGVLACLLLMKRQLWLPQHFALLLPLGEAFGHAWHSLGPTGISVGVRRRILKRRRSVFAGLTAALLASSFIQVPFSVVAPAELVAESPQLVTAPLDAVVEDILFPPGAVVKTGDEIIRFVDLKLRNDQDVAQKKKLVAEADYFRLLQSATTSLKDSRDLARAKAEVDVASAELSYASELLALVTIKATRDGVLVYSDRQEWLGRPVNTGQKLLEIADPLKTQVRLDVFPADAAAVEVGASVSVFWDDALLKAEKGKLLRMSYRPVETPGGGLAFKAYASLLGDQSPRIGKRGVARIDGVKVPLWLYLFHRPFVAIRQMLTV